MNENQLRALVPTLSPVQFSEMLRFGLDVRTPIQRLNISTSDRLLAGIWEFFTALKFIGDARCKRLCDEVKPMVQRFAAAFLLEPPTEVTGYNVSISIVDTKWMCYAGSSYWLNIEDGNRVVELPEPGVVFVGCNLAALFVRQNRWLERARESKHNEADASKTQSKPGNKGS